MRSEVWRQGLRGLPSNLMNWDFHVRNLRSRNSESGVSLVHSKTPPTPDERAVALHHAGGRGADRAIQATLMGAISTKES